MAKQPTQQWILFLDRNQIQIYHPALKEVASIQIPETVVKDVEILKPVELEKILVQVMSQSKIPTLDPVFIILSEGMALSETFPNTTKEGLKDKLEMLIKRAPFNHVGWTSIQNGKNLTLVMTNREIYEVVQEIMERLGFRVNAVTPIVLLGLPNSGFSGQTAQGIIKMGQLVKHHSLIFDSDQALETENQMSSDPRKNKKLLALLIALVLLVVVLGGFVIKMVVFPEKPVQTGSNPTPTETAATAQAVTPATLVGTQTPTPIGGPTLGDYKIQVLNAAGKTGLAESTKETLSKAGFSQIETGNAELINSERIQVVFKPGVPNVVREAVLDGLAPDFPNPTAREQADLPFDVVVTLTNPS